MCGLEFSDLEPSFWQRYKDQGLQVIGINPGGLFGIEGGSIMNLFREQTGVTFPIGWDRSGSYSALFQSGGTDISPFPLDVIIDKQGRVAYVSRAYDPEAMAGTIERLLTQ